MKPSDIYKTLERVSYENILLVWAKSNKKIVKKRISFFLKDLDGVRLKTKGDDLKRYGLKPGPQFSKILKELLCEKLDKKLKTKKEELEFARRLII